jgi:hypothetical protein
MLEFLSSLFSAADERGNGLDDALIVAATDRVVEGTDIRLKGYGNYRKRLRTSVESALVHVINLVDALPAAVEISCGTFGSDPRVHAFFASCNHLQEKIGDSKNVEAYLSQASSERSSEIYGLLSVQWKEASRLGVVLHDDMIQREVRQVCISFFNHNFIGPSESLEETLLIVRKRAFDFIIHVAMERIIAERSKRTELEVQKRLLQRKLTAMKSGNWGLEEMLRPEMSGVRDMITLNAEIETVEQELSKLGASNKVLDRNMQIIKETLDQPRDVLAWRNISMTLDSMNIKVEKGASTRANTIELLEVYSGIGVARIVLPCWYPLNEVPRGKSPISEANRYL